MFPPSIAGLLLTASCLALGLLVIHVCKRSKRGFVVISPRYRSFFRSLGVTEPSDFFNLPGPTPHIVSGHPDRNVARVSLAEDGQRWIAFLKREHRVRWCTRVENGLAGFGFSSRSLREAWTLQMLQREGIACPEWLAAGEDEHGRAFLLVREIEGVELRAVLRTEQGTALRRRIARKIGVTLARLHSAGFRHPDLYANHVFLDPTGGTVHLLDWQRARLHHSLAWRERRRDLAALHATLDDTLATVKERLMCLRAYWRASPPLGVAWRIAVRGVESQAKRLLARRHIREKRQLLAEPQAWICIDGDALCVSPRMYERCGGKQPRYLRSHDALLASAEAVVRRWPALLGDTRALLVRRTRRKRQKRNKDSPEQRQAALLLRLQRHGIAAPQVLAVGRREIADGPDESFLLTEPLADTCSLEAWLVNHARRIGKKAIWSVLRQAGELLHRLHDASCYLDIGSAGCGLAVRHAEREWMVVMDDVDSMMPRRRQQVRQALRDVRRLQQILRAAGCSRTDVLRFHKGYRQTTSSPARSASKGQTNHCLPSRMVRRSAQSKDLLWRRLFCGVRRLHQRADWPLHAGADWADRIMDIAGTDRFYAKQGRTTVRWVLPRRAGKQTTPLTVYLKRHYELPRWQGWLAAMWPGRHWSPAWREWRHLQWAKQQGLPVPQTVAAAEFIGPWGKLRSFLAVEELSGMVSLQEAIPLAALRQDAASFRRWKHALAKEMARLTRMLHDRRCFHKDLYLCHFFIAREDTRALPDDGWRGRVHLIDLHRLGHHPLTGKIWQTKDLAQLLYASEAIGLDARDRLAFWRAYRGESTQRHSCRWMRWLILYRWRRYRLHNARRKLQV